MGIAEGGSDKIAAHIDPDIDPATGAVLGKIEVLIIILDFYFIMWGIWITFVGRIKRHDEISESA